jgi:hypothetical protein
MGKTQITVVGCVSASGMCLPPMVIWDRKTLNPELAKGEVPGTIYGLSSSGWMDMELFEIWFKKHFLRHAPAVRPLILLMDGHSSHFCLDTIRLAVDEGVTLFVLPPSTTHLTQPLDKGIFGPLKVRWRETCHRFLSTNPGRVVTRYDFSQLFGEAWLSTMTVRNIVSGFSTTGIYPVNRDAITLPVSSPEKAQLARMPFYTPAKNHQSRYMMELHNPQLSDQSDDGYSELDDSQESLTLAYHPAEHRSCLSKFLEYPSPPARRGGITEEKNARVLTSEENLQALEEKKRKKDEEDAKKEKRAKERKSKKELNTMKENTSTSRGT